MSLSREPDCDQVSFSVAECEVPVVCWAVNGIEKEERCPQESGDADGFWKAIVLARVP